MVVKGINDALLEARRMGSTKCTWLGRSLTLTHLLIVDDVILLCNGSRRDDSKSREILKLYCTGIYMMVNMQKTSIAFNDAIEEQIKSIPLLELSSRFQILWRFISRQMIIGSMVENGSYPKLKGELTRGVTDGYLEEDILFWLN